MSQSAFRETVELPVLPLRDVVVFPHMVIPLFVGRDKSMRALEQAMEADKHILLVAQKSPEVDDPTGLPARAFEAAAVDIAAQCATAAALISRALDDA